MIKAKSVMMIGGGIQEVKAVEIAQSAGYKVLVTDRNKDAPCFPYADYTAAIDGRDIEGLIAYTLLNKEKLNIAGVFTLTELVTSVAAVTTATGLPGGPLKSAVACQNKELCKEIWIKNKIPTPKGEIVRTVEEAKLFLDKLNHKAFIKPLVGFGGIGAGKILSVDDIYKVFIDNNNQNLLMEELVKGSMHDVNGVFDSNGEFVPLGCFDRFFDHDTPIEIGAVYPSQLNDKTVAEAYKLTKNAALSLGINWGPVKSDLVLTDKGFKILEMAPRLHGPKGTLYLSSMLNSESHLERILDLITCDTATINVSDITNGVAAYEILNHPGKPFTRINGIGRLQNRGVETLLLNTSSSQNSYQNNSDVVGYIFSKGKSLDQIRNSIKIIKKGVCFD